MPSKVSNGTASSRFELPALDLNFGSITDGTNIPPPPKSPVDKPKPVEKPTAVVTAKQDEATRTVEKPANVAASTANGNLAGIKRPADDIPPSPTVSTGRPGSLRRLLSRSLLNNTYAEGQHSSQNGTATLGGSRPPSRSGGGSFIDERKSKRASGWFKRLRGGDSKRSSLILEQPHSTSTAPISNKPSGPPPPMIPELADLEKDHGSLGGDMFKNIK